ncbi:uncharacterized protein LOC113505058 [Trichoplusia ni]|uniref:Uncharacterized protein LOC113505058 n=1 Tax=Trichoplusia ni TaxID=7111 RepID=A0A7E5WT78_TRINI|nr:uncharacterized protein LOC113505058 [Trichoplusia ni]
MKSGVLLLTFCTVFAHNNAKEDPPRLKRGAVGALHIVTNHAQPIHADVKPETAADTNDKAPEKVTAPDDGFTTYEIKSLRKSLPYTSPTPLELIRSVSRVITLIVLFVSAVLEFYPTFHSLMCTIVSFVNGK